MKSYIIHLVRHGMTEGNKTGQYPADVIGSGDFSTENLGKQNEKGN